MVYCARSCEGPLDERGVIGRARSTDLVHREALPPLTEAGEFGQLEVPQLICLAERWYLVFCTADHSVQRLRRTGADGAWYGTHYLMADTLDGPFRLIDDEPLAADRRGSSYGGRIELDRCGRPVFLAWTRLDGDGHFAGELADPIPLQVAPDGRLWLDRRVPHALHTPHQL